MATKNKFVCEATNRLALMVCRGVYHPYVLSLSKLQFERKKKQSWQEAFLIYLSCLSVKDSSR